MERSRAATVLILSGPPGVGKTTASKLLCERSARSVHLESDVFFRFILSGHVEPWRPEAHSQNQVVMEIVAAAAARYADAGYLTIVDGIVIPGWFLEPLRDALRESGHRAAYAVLQAPLSVCLSRARSRERDPLGDGAAIERIWRSFADLGQLEPHALNVGEREPAEVAAALERAMEDGALLL